MNSDSEKLKQAQNVFDQICTIGNVTQKLAAECVAELDNGLSPPERAYAVKVLIQAMGCLADHGTGIVGGTNKPSIFDGPEKWFL